VKIRSTIKIQEKTSIIFKVNWDNAEIKLKEARRDDFQDYIRNLDLYRTQDSRKFNRIMNSLLKYKSRQKIVRGIATDDEILYCQQKRKKVKEFLKSNLDDQRS
jgi:hypothetical protein